MTLRKYKPNDCADMAKLFYDTVHTINAKDYTKEQLDAWATGNINLEAWSHSFLEHNTILAEIDGKIVGFADMDKTGYLDRLYIHKDFQGRGIATALVNELEQSAQASGIFRYETYASITARSFFEKRGYTVEIENKVVRNGVTLVNYKMVKQC